MEQPISDQQKIEDVNNQQQPVSSKKSTLKLLPLILGILLLSVITGAVGYYLGSRQLPSVVTPEDKAISQEDQGNCTLEAKVCPDGSSVGRIPPKCEFAKCPQSNQEVDTSGWKNFAIDKLPNSSFNSFTLKYPSDWTIHTVYLDGNSVNNGYTVKISKDNYEIDIYQAAFGGALCVFTEKDNQFNGPKGDFRNKQYKEIPSNIGLLRRVESISPSASFSICSKEDNSEYYSQPSKIGGLMYKTPDSPSEEILMQMDSILQTILLR